MTILLAILVYVDSASIKVIADTTLDARFYPKFLAVLMILLSLIIILRVGIQLSRAEHSSSGSAKENKHAAVKEMLPAVETLLLLGLYVFAIEPVGFLLSTPFYVFGQAWILAPKSQRNPVRFALLGVLSAVAIYCIFKFGFQLLVPPGILG
nr:tripartite tricarboxylate transporter TctB family protein [uncultured Oscillibacter sp.]